ncbi:MAG: Spy/CpxP family protein refolding chaperone [Gallionellaceae bacterium]|jgi:Spy/CpxP family protein refolding chaperone
MNEQTTTTQDSNTVNKDRCCGSNGHEHRCHGGHRGRCIGKVLGVMLMFGLGFFAGKSFACEPGFGHHGGPQAFMSGKPLDVEQANKFADKRMQRLLKEVKASDAQKAKAGEIVKASVAKGAPLADKMRDNHVQMRKLMSAATLDKATIEALRAEQIKLADEASKLMTQTMQDVAEVLTPEQRAKLADKMEQRHGWLHHD